MKRISASGFTLVEMLASVAILGVIAAAVIPLLSSNDPQKLGAAAEETANMLRFALSEARRTGGFVLVDGETTAGQIRLFSSDSSGTSGPAIDDPLTKRAAILDVTGSPFSRGVILTPEFIGGGVARPQLLIGATAAGLTLESMNGLGTRSALEPNSRVLLSYGDQNVSAGINEVTGRVSLP